MAKLYVILSIGIALLLSCNKNNISPKQEPKPGAVNFDSLPLPKGIKNISGYKDNQGVYCAGFLDGSFWVGVYNNEYQLIAQTWMGDVKSKITTENGDSINYVHNDINIKKGEGWMVPIIQSNSPVYYSIIRYTDNSYYQIYYRFDFESKYIYLIKTHMSAGDKQSVGTNLHSIFYPWFNNSYIFNGWTQEASGERKNFVWILDKNFNRLYNFFMYEFIPNSKNSAISYTEYLSSFNGTVTRENFNHTRIWETNLLNNNTSHRSRVDSTIFDIGPSSAIVKFYITNSDISKETRTYKIDINTGKLL